MTGLLDFLAQFLAQWFPTILAIIAMIGGILVCVAWTTYLERKVIAAMQLRRGPNVVGPFGLLQPLADGLKLLSKEPILPTAADKVLFLLAPIVLFVLAFVAWAVIPLGPKIVIANVNMGLLYLFAVSSLGVYGIIIAGWASNSRYAFLGALRSAAQMISYEICIGVILLCVLALARSLNLTAIVEAQQNLWFCVPLFPVFIIFFICTLAETNRHPFDLPEAEAELVAGYQVEYSSMPFALFYLGEYANMLLMSAMISLLFLGGWLSPLGMLDFIPSVVWFGLKILLCLYVFIWVRASLPRYRYDQLMRLGWKIFLPFSLLWFTIVALVVFFTSGGNG